MCSKYKVWISRILHILLVTLFFTIIRFFDYNLSDQVQVGVVIAVIFSFHTYEIRLIKKELFELSVETDAALNKAGVISLSMSRNQRLMEKLNIFDFIDSIKTKIRNLN